jgi:hypothetical protein
MAVASLAVSGCMWAAYAAYVVSANAADYNITEIQSGDTADVFFEINTTGKLYLSIRGKDGFGCVDLWWIIWPLGSIAEVGKRCRNVTLDIPGWSKLAAASKLRARAIAGPVKIIGSSNEKVAFGFPKVSF